MGSFAVLVMVEVTDGELSKNSVRPVSFKPEALASPAVALLGESIAEKKPALAVPSTAKEGDCTEDVGIAKDDPAVKFKLPFSALILEPRLCVECASVYPEILLNMDVLAGSRDDIANPEVKEELDGTLGGTLPTREDKAESGWLTAGLMFWFSCCLSACVTSGEPGGVISSYLGVTRPELPEFSADLPVFPVATPEPSDAPPEFVARRKLPEAASPVT